MKHNQEKNNDVKRRFYKVKAKCGHVGRKKCVWVVFATTAYSAKEAAKRVREFKRVKHGHKDAIAWVEEITQEEFIEVKANNDADPYLHCKNVQEQRKIEDFESRIEPDFRNIIVENKTRDVTYKKKKQSIIDREMRKYYNQAQIGEAV